MCGNKEAPMSDTYVCESTVSASALAERVKELEDQLAELHDTVVAKFQLGDKPRLRDLVQTYRETVRTAGPRSWMEAVDYAMMMRELQ